MIQSQSYTATSRTQVGVLSALLGLIIFMRCRPYFLWDYEEIIRPLCSVFVTIVAVMNFSKAKWSKWIFLLLALSYIWASAIVDGSSLITILNFLGFAFIPLIKKELVLSTYSAFRKILIFMVGISFFFYLLSFIPGLLSPEIMTHENGPDLYTYQVFPLLVKSIGKVTGEVSFRFHAFFDEPGLLGTIIGLMMVAERMNFRKTGNVALLIFGIFSMSFYFYVTLIIGLLLFSGKVNIKWVVILAAFILITYNIPFFYKTIWYRFAFDADTGTLVGDNRNGWGLDDYFESILWSPVFFTGLGSQFADQFSGAASLYLVIVKHGLIFVLLNVSAFILLTVREIKDKAQLVAFFTFFILTLYQRPGFYATYSMFLYTMTIYMFADFSNNKNMVLKNK